MELLPVCPAAEKTGPELSEEDAIDSARFAVRSPRDAAGQVLSKNVIRLLH
jgi:cytochrome c